MHEVKYNASVCVCGSALLWRHNGCWETNYTYSLDQFRVDLSGVARVIVFEASGVRHDELECACLEFGLYLSVAVTRVSAGSL